MQTLHGAYESYGEEVVATLPGGPQWLEPSGHPPSLRGTSPSALRP